MPDLAIGIAAAIVRFLLSMPEDGGSNKHGWEVPDTPGRGQEPQLPT
jgi:hypothetical protein